MPRSRSRSPNNSQKRHYNKGSPRHSSPDTRYRGSNDDYWPRYSNKISTLSPQAKEEQDKRTIFVWQLSKKIHESDLREFFSKAGSIKDVKLIKDQRTDRPKGIAYVEFVSADSIKKAMTFAGMRILGVPIQINQVFEKTEVIESSSGGLLDNELIDRGGIGLGNTGRLALMAKLAEGTGLELPKSALELVQNSIGRDGGKSVAVSDIINNRMRYQGANGATDCLVIGNMFDKSMELTREFLDELREDVTDECRRLGRVTQVFVDHKHEGGNVYVRCGSMDDAIKCVNVMNKRYFSGYGKCESQ